jgi:hypothetical protein
MTFLHSKAAQALSNFDVTGYVQRAPAPCMHGYQRTGTASYENRSHCAARCRRSLSDCRVRY